MGVQYIERFSKHPFRHVTMTTTLYITVAIHFIN